MSDEITPERLDALLDGSEPAETQADRDVLALAASLKDASPRANDALRERVRAVAREAPEPRPARSRRRRLRAAAPALAALAIGIVGVIVISNEGTSDQAASPTAEPVRTELSQGAPAPSGGAPESGADSATSVAPRVSAGPPTVTVPIGALGDRQARAQRIVGAADGALTAVAQPGLPPSVLLSARVPPERRAEVSAALLGLGDGATELSADADGTLSLLLTEAPGP